MLNKDKLTELLGEEVREVRRSDPYALGVIFFGSWTRPDYLPGHARPDSDIDLIDIYDRDICGGLDFTIRGAVHRRLNPLGLSEHFVGAISAGSVRRFNDGGIDFIDRLRFRVVLSFLDRYSIPITVDRNLNALIGREIRKAVIKEDKRLDADLLSLPVEEMMGILR